MLLSNCLFVYSYSEIYIELVPGIQNKYDGIDETFKRGFTHDVAIALGSFYFSAISSAACE